MPKEQNALVQLLLELGDAVTAAIVTSSHAVGNNSSLLSQATVPELFEDEITFVLTRAHVRVSLHLDVTSLHRNTEELPGLQGVA